MSFQRFFWYYLWIAPHALQIAVAVIMIRRRLYREFPIFLSYTLFEVLQFAVLFPLMHFEKFSNVQYQSVHAAGDAFSIALRFGVIHEIFENVFRQYPALNQLGRLLFRWATGLLVVVAVFVALSTSGPDIERVGAGLLITSRAISIVQCGLLVFLLLFSSYFGLSWRNYVFGTALGLGIYASVELATSAILWQFGPQLGSRLDLDTVNLIIMASYHCSVLVWLFYFLSPEPVLREVRSVPSHELESWNRELERLLQR
jgi:hypothetical protein